MQNDEVHFGSSDFDRGRGQLPKGTYGVCRECSFVWHEEQFHLTGLVSFLLNINISQARGDAPPEVDEFVISDSSSGVHTHLRTSKKHATEVVENPKAGADAGILATGGASSKEMDAGILDRSLQGTPGTPDGEPPALESECTDWQGQPGYGLCKAFCEAKDCDLVLSSYCETNGCDTDKKIPSCERIKLEWENLTGEDSLPCEEETCLGYGAPCAFYSNYEPYEGYMPNGNCCSAAGLSCEGDFVLQKSCKYL